MAGKLGETFDEAYESAKIAWHNIGDLILATLQALVWFTVPFWILPYIIIRKMKEWYNGED